MIQAVFFDFDGVIVDSEPLHYRALQAVLEPLGLGFTWPEYMQTYVGFDDRGVFDEVYGAARMPLAASRNRELVEQKAQAFLDLVRQTPPEYPGVRALIDGLRIRNVPVGLCTGARPGDIAPILRALNLDDAFEVVVTADDVPASKPNPACYRLVRERMETRRGIALPAGNCAAVEDTPAGVTAARGAGMRVLAVTHTHPRELLSGASWVVSSLAAVRVEDLLAGRPAAD